MIFFSLAKEIIGKQRIPFFFRNFFDSLITFVVSLVPSLPDLQLTFLNQGDILAISSLTPEISFIIKSNFFFFPNF